MASTPKWVRIDPALDDDRAAQLLLRRCARKLADLNGDVSTPKQIADVRAESSSRASALGAGVAPRFVLAASVLCDLRAQGWQMRVDHAGIEVASPDFDDVHREEAKAQVRASHLLERDEQLRQPAVRRFIRQMERQRLWRGQWRSIFSVMRDGRELSAKLHLAASEGDLTTRLALLRNAIDPYVQVIAQNETCEFTGIQLSDIWRYFRHTWNIAYNSTPGRKLWFLIRDRAAPCHPIVGIAALGSSIVQLSARDEWIGWTADSFFRQLHENPTRKWSHWVARSLNDLMGDVHVSDFVKQGVLTRADLECPSDKVISKLKTIAHAERRRHRAFPGRSEHKRAGDRDVDAAWRTESETPLFRAKRAETLARLLAARQSLERAGFNHHSPESLRQVLEDPAAKRAIGTILRLVKAAHIGVDMMDITVCGAVPPYNAIIGGKLVALLMTAPEIRRAYSDKYRTASSIIASAMAGRRVRRRPRLVLIGTTSLYGRGSSQYNRVRMPAEMAGGAAGLRIEYLELGRTRGFGSFHFSRDTLRAFELVLAKSQNGRQVNSIFGEGVNPKLRKVRGALAVAGLKAEMLIQHGSSRVIYGVPLATNFRQVLLGLEDTPEYILPQSSSGEKKIVDYWLGRWVASRIDNPRVLEAVRSHVTSHPVLHGGRVVLPELAEETGPLFREDVRGDQGL